MSSPSTSSSGSDSDASSSSSLPSVSSLKSTAKRKPTSQVPARISESATGKGTNDGLTGSKKRKRDEVGDKQLEERKRVEDVVDEQEPEEEEEEVQVLSHKEQRKLKKKQKLLAEGAVAEPGADSNAAKTNKTQAPADGKPKKKGKKGEENADKLPRRQNSVWVGNLSYRTTPEALQAFFTDAGAGEITRVHMPTKGVPGVEKMKWAKTVKENRGFAYVDFATPEGKTLAISLSEKNLDGRRLLIKDGDDFTGRPAITPTSAADGSEDPSQHDPTATNSPEKQTGFSVGPTKTAKKILAAQKQPPCPCLFLGNLGFEATEEKIKQMFEGHARAIALMKAEKEKKKTVRNAKGKRKDDDLLGVEHNEEEEEEEMKDGEIDVEIDVGIRKVRMGTFEDSGVCKGWAFVDFTSTQHATAALTNPANHFLDGRALVVEYASLDAARRGGYRPEVEKKEREKKIKGKEANRMGKDKYNDWKKKLKPGRRRADDNGEVNAGGLDAEAGATRGEDNAHEEPYPKRSRTEAKDTDATRSKVAKFSKKEKRQKPGAALATAQREKYAIVPSEGTRLKFS